VVALRAIMGGTVAASIAVAFAVAPAFGAPDLALRSSKRVAPPPRASGFTPAAADPRLAAAFARAGLGASDFRFTPSDVRRDSRAVTVAVRARSTRGGQDNGRLAVAAPTVGLAPIAYNLGVAVGWKRFAIAGEMAKVDLAGAPGSRESADLALSYSASKFTGRVKAATDRALPGAPKLVDDGPSYSLDMGGSYSLTRNLDVTAGVRYRSDRERLARLSDDRRDSQAVYVGTAFRF